MNLMQFYEPFNAPEPMSTKLSTVCRVVYLLCNDFAYQEPAYPVISGSSTSGIYVAITAIAEHTGPSPSESTPSKRMQRGFKNATN
jgi:hypothetical protein